MPLGTREVEGYSFPSWLFDKILFVEKKGLWPVFQAAGLAELYDMAIVAGEGYATEACRVLFQNAEQGKEYQLFVLHDADPHGYNIARTLRDGTARMPGYRTQVIDIGLTLQEALDLGLRAEEFTRKKAIPQELELTDLEREYFKGRQTGRKSWIARRVELNAFTSPDLVAYTRRKLEAAGVRGKVIPDAAALPPLAEDLLRTAVNTAVDDALDQLLETRDLKERVAECLRQHIPLDEARQWITDAFAQDGRVSWRKAMQHAIRDHLVANSAVLDDTVRRTVLQAINESRHDGN